MEHKTPLLDTIHSSFDMKGLSTEQLKQLADELRQDLIFHVSQTGGHFGASLGVVELTVALHHVFDTPHDRLIWDVGHQSYPHKILTGRRSLMPTLRQYQGLSGFPKRSESPYDAFGTAHSSTSISAALGMAVASDLLGEERQSIAVIGDGAMSAGMAFEAMNNAEKQKLIVILNDNDMSIDPPVGALNGYLSRLISSRPFHKMRELAKDALRYFPKSVGDVARRAEEYARGMVTGGTLFEELGFYYIGPLDGHNLDHLIPVLRNARDLEREGPLLIHVITEKGRGYAPAEAAADKLHATAKFDVKSGVQVKPVSPPLTYTKVFAESLIAEAEADEKIVAVTAAMPSGTGLDLFAKKFPDRCFDVGIAEQHAVTFAAGLACEGVKPVVAIYSTFLQRGYDQVVHDVALQNLPVRFAMDRAGLVGADGATHAGSFDVAYLGCLPNMTLMAAADEVELRHMVATLGAYDQGPIGLRYPRGDVTGKVILPEKGTPLEIGKGRVLRQGSDIVLLSYGTRLTECLLAADILENECGISVTVADARFAKPLDEDLLRQLTTHHPRMITIEEGSVGGFGSFVSQFLSQQGIFDKGYIFRSMVLPDYFMDHGTQTQQYAEAQLDARALIECVKKLMGKTLSLCA